MQPESVAVGTAAEVLAIMLMKLMLSGCCVADEVPGLLPSRVARVRKQCCYAVAAADTASTSQWKQLSLELKDTALKVLESVLSSRYGDVDAEVVAVTY